MQPIGDQDPRKKLTSGSRKMYRVPKTKDNKANYWKLIIVIIISFVFIAGQFIGGVISHSISVISDATHLITDLIGFVVSFIFLYYSNQKPSNNKITFGFHRLEVVGALANLFIIWVIAIFLFYQSTLRIINKEFVEEPKVMLIIAGGGLAVNIVMYFVLHGSDGHSHGLGQKCEGHGDEGHNHAHQSEQDKSESMQNMPKINTACDICHEEDEPMHKCKTTGERQKIEMAPLPNVGDHVNQQSGKKYQEHSHDGVPCKGHGQVKVEEIQKGGEKHDHKHDHSGHNHDHKHDHGSHDHKHDHGSHDHSHDGHNHGGHGHSHDDHPEETGQSMSMRAAILHALSDVIQSIGLLISSLIIYFCGSDNGAEVKEFNNWHYLDPITTYIFTVLVFISTWPITKQCYYIILEATPEEFDAFKLKDEFASTADVKDIHDFHLWELRPGKVLLTAHVFSTYGQEKKVLQKLTTLCRKNKIYHTTIQVEHWEEKEKDDYIICDHDIH